MTNAPPDLSRTLRPNRWMVFFGSLLPIVLGLVGLALLEGRRAGESLPWTVPPAEAARTRLVVFWIDSLSMHDLERPEVLGRLRARLERQPALHGPVRACADAVSVPCFTAMVTGRDGFSAFSLARNFGGLEQGIEGSVLQALQRTGLRLGYLGDPIFSGVARGFDYAVIEHDMHDLSYIERGMVALDAERLDVAIVHLRESDKLSHTDGPPSQAYIDSLNRVDEAIDAAVSRLRPTDHWVVLGDHGHEPDGRHFAGLDVPTYAAFFGPRITRTLKHPMAITDHAAIWAQLFGAKFGTPGSWVDAYFEGQTLTPPTELPDVPGGTSLPLTSAAAVVFVALLVALPRRAWGALRRPKWGPILGVAGLIGVCLLLGAVWVELRPTLGWRPRAFNIGAGIGAGLVGAVLLAPLLAREAPTPPRGPGLFLAGALLLVAPTVYKYGGVAAALGTLLLVLAVGVVPALRSRQYGRLAATLAAVLVLWSVWDPAVRNFAVRWFSVYTETIGDGKEWAAGVLFVVAAALSAGREGRVVWLAAAAVGLLGALAAGQAWLSPRAFIAPCVAALPVTVLAVRRPALAPLAVALAVPALTFLFRGDAGHLGPMAAVLAAFALWPHARRHGTVLEHAATLLILVWAGFWVTLGCRASGLDFQYFFAWITPGSDPKDTWALNALTTTAKYLLLPVLGVLFARRVAPDALDHAGPLAFSLARGRLALVLVFLAAFCVHGAALAGPFVTADVVQEAMIWLLALIALMLGNAPGGARAQALG